MSNLYYLENPTVLDTYDYDTNWEEQNEKKDVNKYTHKN